MTVYIDDMYQYPMGQFGRMKMSHMIADTEKELHAMAAAIGIARRWYQRDHYDVLMAYREKAIKLGATPITLRQLSAMHLVRGRDPNVKLCAPDDAERLRGEIIGRGAPPLTLEDVGL
jgi:hypothetical protein